jgi:hypothetical protein
MTTLFNLSQYEVAPQPQMEIDPYWDELVLDCSGKVEDNGQTTLFYDASDEPPDPDDFHDLNDYEVAWSDWEKQHPDYKPAMSPFPEQTDDDFMDVLEESQVQGWHFEEGKVYWHSSRNSQFKITKLFNTVSKAQGYFAGEIIKKKLGLSELSPLPEQSLPTCKTAIQQELKPINSEICQPVEVLPEQLNNVLEGSKVNQWVEPYYVSRGGNKYWYYRYCYYQKRIIHIHIPGGNTMSSKCLETKERVESAIAQGKSPGEIRLLISPAA